MQSAAEAEALKKTNERRTQKTRSPTPVTTTTTTPIKHTHGN